MASNVCLYKFIKNLASKTWFDNFSYQVLFWHDFLLIEHQKFLKNAKLKRLTERQCVITLPMTFNSAWLWKLKFEIENLTKTVKMKMTRTISISFRMNQTIQEFSSWESHMKKSENVFKKWKKKQESFGRKNRNCFPRNLRKFKANI